VMVRRHGRWEGGGDLIRQRTTTRTSNILGMYTKAASGLFILVTENEIEANCISQLPRSVCPNPQLIPSYPIPSHPIPHPQAYRSLLMECEIASYNKPCAPTWSWISVRYFIKVHTYCVPLHRPTETFLSLVVMGPSSSHLRAVGMSSYLVLYGVLLASYSITLHLPRTSWLGNPCRRREITYIRSTYHHLTPALCGRTV
jgi:hypothetical protein